MSFTSTPPIESILPNAIIGESYVVSIRYNINNPNENIEFIRVTGLPSGLSAQLNEDQTVIISGTPNGLPSTNQLDIALETRDGSNPLEIYSHDGGKFFLTVNVDCIASDSRILMGDGISSKQIQYIERGDWVAGDLENYTQYQVARVIKIVVYPQTPANGCIFRKNCLGKKIPKNDLIISFLHPVIYKNHRAYASDLEFLPGVELYHNVKMKQLFPKDKDGNYSAWDLQFETVGSYVANGMLIQSRHPQSFLTPLPNDLYFNQSLYSDEKKDDFDTSYQYPLITRNIPSL